MRWEETFRGDLCVYSIVCSHGSWMYISKLIKLLKKRKTLQQTQTHKYAYTKACLLSPSLGKSMLPSFVI